MIEEDDAPRATRLRLKTRRALPANEAVAVLREQAIVIGVFALLCAAVAYGASLLIPPSFVASTQIFIDPRTIQALDNTLGQAQGDSNAEIIFVESQAQILTSRNVLRRVVMAEQLYDDPEFNGLGGGDPLAGFALRLHREAPAEGPDAAVAAAEAALDDRVTVRRPERTFVLDVTVKARTADKAARLANAVAQAFFDEQAAARSQMAQRANAALTGRLDELRDHVRQSEERAEAFRRAHGLIGTRTQLVSEQQLTDANTQLALARSRVFQAQSRLDDVRRYGSGDETGASPEAIVSPTVTLLRGQQAEARRRLDNALSQYGPRHPAVGDARSEVKGLDRAVAAELARIAQSAKVDLARATSTEAAQRRIVEQLSDQASNASEAFVQLGELEREVDANKNLLNTFLSRARETSEVAQVNTGNARVISTAQPPRTRSFPPRGSIFILLGLLGGLGLGIALALWTAMQRLPRVAAFDEVEEPLPVHEPAPRRRLGGIA